MMLCNDNLRNGNSIMFTYIYSDWVRILIFGEPTMINCLFLFLFSFRILVQPGCLKSVNFESTFCSFQFFQKTNEKFLPLHTDPNWSILSNKYNPGQPIQKPGFWLSIRPFCIRTTFIWVHQGP